MAWPSGWVWTPSSWRLRTSGTPGASARIKSLTAVLETGAARIGWAEKRHKPGQGPLYEGV